MKFWQVDAFTNRIFHGNPAAVYIFKEEPSEILMQNIAKEMNLSETAFVIQTDPLTIRWFTPNGEVNLCGHATLSAAHILWEQKIFTDDTIFFQSKSGPLTVTKKGREYLLDFPLQPPQEKREYQTLIEEILGIKPLYIGSNGEDCMAVVQDDDFVRKFSPDHQKISLLKERGFVLTAKDRKGEFDYIYRAFYPKLLVPEDPVTGSANTCLASYWSKQLQKNRLTASQLSERGGNLTVEVKEDRVFISGGAVTVFEGEIDLSLV